MRKRLLLLLAFVAFMVGVFLLLRGSHPRTSAFTSSADATAEDSRTADFHKTVKPILQARCQPCHFQGGKMHDELPFDKPETITRLGTKLFTRIKDEGEQQKIREFLEASKSESR